MRPHEQINNIEWQSQNQEVFEAMKLGRDAMKEMTEVGSLADF